VDSKVSRAAVDLRAD
jgi:N-formylglutamate amidohydrolase